jgi:putative addiction module component (TIGR02574 family)
MQLAAAEIERLSPEERLRPIEQLCDSLADAEVPLPPAQAAELERRLATFDADRAQAVGGDELKAELARRCRFPYGLFYRTLPDALVALACFHARRDPRRWQERV